MFPGEGNQGTPTNSGVMGEDNAKLAGSPAARAMPAFTDGIISEAALDEVLAVVDYQRDADCGAASGPFS